MVLSHLLSVGMTLGKLGSFEPPKPLTPQIIEERVTSLLTKNLSFLNHADVFNSRNCFFGRKEVFGTQHSPRSFLDKPMILLNNVIELNPIKVCVYQ